MLGNDTTLTGLPRAALVNVPLVKTSIFESRLVFDAQVMHSALSHVGQTDVALGALAVYVHQSRFSNLGIAIVA